MIGMAHNVDVAVAGVAVRAELLERRLGVGAVARERLRDLLVDDDEDLDALLGLAPQHAVQPPFAVLGGWPPQKQLGAEPPVLDVDDLARALERDADGPKVVAAVHIPLDRVADRDGREAAVAVRAGHFLAPPVDLLLVRLVVPVVAVEDVCELSPRVLGVHQPDLEREQARVVAVACLAREVAFPALALLLAGRADRQFRGTAVVAASSRRHVSCLYLQEEKR